MLKKNFPNFALREPQMPTSRQGTLLKIGRVQPLETDLELQFLISLPSNGYKLNNEMTGSLSTLDLLVS